MDLKHLSISTFVIGALMAPRPEQCSGPSHSQRTFSESVSGALVWEDYEIFEAEAAELTIEEVDDPPAALLHATDTVNSISVHDLSLGVSNGISLDMESSNAHTCSHHLPHSPHSLAATSVVVPTQHAQTTEYKLLALTGPTMSVESYLKINTSSSSQRFCQHDRTQPIESTTQDWIESLSVHLINISHLNSHSPNLWPQHFLTYADAPAFVQAVEQDLMLFATRFGVPSIDITSCDQVCDWTTCQLTVCQADVELIESPLSTGTAPQHNQPHHRSQKTPLIPVNFTPQRLSLAEHVSVRLCPFSGVRPELFSPSNAMTAVYLLLVPIESTSSSLISRAAHGLEDVSPRPIQSAAFPVLALLVSLVPSAGGFDSVSFMDRICINHRVSSALWGRQMNAFSALQTVPLIALVDIVTVDVGDGNRCLKAIIHQRLHHLPTLTFILQAGDS
ncbi:hypothetical protein P879_08008 [Paragonimus westermani]|uniref:Uncharacterized protein n=1 Tax=Paragonimus westermani TaxID=34504 RepID=A0A8T0D6F4_9TREM|nr:hypothetical protein P879_08008 [Paragonimus westermani]